MKHLILSAVEHTALFPLPNQPDTQTEGEAPTPEPDLEIIARIPALPPEEAHASLPVPNYQPDQAIRQATLARAEQWQEEDACLSYRASNDLLVYLGNKKIPLTGGGSPQYHQEVQHQHRCHRPHRARLVAPATPRESVD